MARINIEECWWSDVRRSKLIKLMGDDTLADGLAIKLWRLAQEHWGKGRQCIPIEIFNHIEAASKLIEAGLAEVRSELVYVRGSSQYLDWHAEKREAAAKGGKKSAETRRKKFGSAQPKAKKPRSKPEALPKYAEPSGSGSLSDSLSGLDSKIPVSSKQTKAGAFIVGYKSRFKNRWGVEVNLEGKDSGIAKRVAERLSYENIELYLDAFFAMPDAELVKKKHPIFLFEVKLNEITVFAETGKFTTAKEAKQADNMASNMQLLKKIDEGSI